jgi:hypothetical protein
VIVELNTELLHVCNSLYLIDEAIRRILLDDSIKMKAEALTAYLAMLAQIEKAFKHSGEACAHLGLALRGGGPDGVEFEQLNAPKSTVIHPLGPTDEEIAAMVEEASGARRNREIKDADRDLCPVPPSPRKSKSHHHHGAFDPNVCQPRDGSKCKGAVTRIACDVPGCGWHCTKCAAHNKRPAQTLALHRRKEHSKK